MKLFYVSKKNWGFHAEGFGSDMLSLLKKSKCMKYEMKRKNLHAILDAEVKVFPGRGGGYNGIMPPCTHAERSSRDMEEFVTFDSRKRAQDSNVSAKSEGNLQADIASRSASTNVRVTRDAKSNMRVEGGESCGYLLVRKTKYTVGLVYESILDLLSDEFLISAIQKHIKYPRTEDTPARLESIERDFGKLICTEFEVGVCLVVKYSEQQFGNNVAQESESTDTNLEAQADAVSKAGSMAASTAANTSSKQANGGGQDEKQLIKIAGPEFKESAQLSSMSRAEIKEAATKWAEDAITSNSNLGVIGIRSAEQDTIPVKRAIEKVTQLIFDSVRYSEDVLKHDYKLKIVLEILNARNLLEAYRAQKSTDYNAVDPSQQPATAADHQQRITTMEIRALTVEMAICGQTRGIVETIQQRKQREDREMRIHALQLKRSKVSALPDSHGLFSSSAMESLLVER